ncbi:MAG TPA: TonB-dependent receptor [Cellvibrionaceae bacterium]
MKISAIGTAKFGESSVNTGTPPAFKHKFLSMVLAGIYLNGAPGFAQTNDAQVQSAVSEVSVTAAGNSESADAAPIEEVLVSAQLTKTLEAVHDEPRSISVVTGSELNRELATDYFAITKRLANVAFNQANTRSATLSIRGIGKRGSAETQDPSVLVAVDGVNYGLISLGNFDFYDIETVEAYRGPSGTLGGKGGSAGQVTFTTRRPSFTKSADFSVGFGSWNTTVAQAAGGGPIIDGLLAWRGALLANKGEGYYRNEFGNDKNRTFYNKDRVAGRLQFLLTPTENINVRYSHDKQPKGNQLENGLTFRHDQPEFYPDNPNLLTDPSGTTVRAKLYGYNSQKKNPDGTPALGADGKPILTWNAPRAWFSDRSSPETGLRNYSYYDDYLVEEGKGGRVAFNDIQGQYNSTGGDSLDVDWTFGEHTLRSLTAYRFYYFNAHNDEGTSFDVSTHGGGGIQFKQYSQEFSLSNNPDGGLLDYKVGVFLYKSETEIDSRVGWGADAGAWFATTSQYDALDRTAGVNRGAGLALLRDSVHGVFRDGNTWVDTKSNALYGQADWHWTDAATLTFGARVGTEDRSTEDDVPMSSYGSAGIGLNPSSIRGINLGGFDSIGNGRLGSNVRNPDGTTSLIDTNTAEQKRLADKVANRYFGVATTEVAGAAYESLTAAQKNQVGVAKNIRSTQIGQIYRNVKSYYDDTLYGGTLSQSYKFSDDLTAYATWQRGEKSGTAYNINGVPVGVKPEVTNAFEVGIKSFFFDKALTLNADLYYSTIKDYQQSVRTVDEFATKAAVDNLPPAASQAEINAATAYITSAGNVPKVIAQGLEFDATYTGIENFTFRISGAYNDAHYDEFKNVPKPDELAYLTDPYLDRSGQTIPGASKWTVNSGVEYSLPLETVDFRTSLNAAYLSEYDITDVYSKYARLPDFTVFDFSIGIASQENGYDVSLVAKNLFDTAPHEEGWTSYQPFLQRRWLGVVVSGHF